MKNNNNNSNNNINQQIVKKNTFLYLINAKDFKIIKYIFILFEFIILFFLTLSNICKIKIALCTMGKNENLYVREFVDYYLKLGIDKIFIYDDNDLNTEKIKDAIPLTKSVIIYENIKNRIKNQGDAFTDCYNNNKKYFNWFLMVDMDEYLVIVNNTLKKYLSSSIFKKCDFIKFHWVFPTVNNSFHYENKSLFKRFKGPYKSSNAIISSNILNKNFVKFCFRVSLFY